MNEDQTSERSIVKLLLVEGMMKLGLPLTAAVQLVGYLVKYGLTLAYIADCLAAMNVFLFALTAMSEGVLFGIMIWYCERQVPEAAVERTRTVIPAAERKYSAV